MNKVRAMLALLIAIFTFAVGLPAHAVRTTLTAVTPPSLTAGALTANSADFTFTAADTSNLNEVVLSGREILLVYNSDGTNPYTFTVTSVADALGRTGDITTYSLAAGEYGVVGPFPVIGWSQSNGKLYFQGSNAAIKFAIIKIPNWFRY